jgi:hypothetical protein
VRFDREFGRLSIRLQDREALLVDWVEMMETYNVTANFDFVRAMVLRTAQLVRKARAHVPESVLSTTPAITPSKTRRMARSVLNQPLLLPTLISLSLSLYLGRRRRSLLIQIQVAGGLQTIQKK